VSEQGALCLNPPQTVAAVMAFTLEKPWCFFFSEKGMGMASGCFSNKGLRPEKRRWGALFPLVGLNLLFIAWAHFAKK